jgi:hypothetical protein
LKINWLDNNNNKLKKTNQKVGKEDNKVKEVEDSKAAEADIKSHRKFNISQK